MSAFRNIQVILSANTTDLQAGLARAGTEVKAFNREVEASNAGLMASGSLMKVGLAAGAAAAAVGLAYASAKAIEFDRSMRNVNSLSGMSEAAFHDLEKQVVHMSTQLPQSANTLAEGLYDIASSGFQGADGMTVLRAAAESASAGLSNTATSAKAITAVLNAYGLEAGDAADVSDTLFSTVNLGVISFDELASNIGDVVGGAAAASVSIDQVGSAIATMTLAGIGGAEATTSLNQLITKLIQPSDALAEVYHDLGWESGEAALKTLGLHGVMEQLRLTTGGSVSAWMDLFPEIRAARGAFALAANEGANYNKVASQIEDKNNRAGATARTLHEQMKAVANQAQLAKNQLDAAAISVGVRLLPMFLGLIDAGRDVGGAIGDVVDEIARRGQPTWEAFGQIVGDVWDILVQLGHDVAPVAQAIGGLAVVSVLDFFNALMPILADVTGFLAHHREIVLAVAVAYTISLLPALATTITRLEVGLVMAIYKSLTAMEAWSAGAKTMATGSTAMLGVAGALIAIALDGWQQYTKAADRATRALDKWKSANKSGDLGAQVTATAGLNAELQRTRDRLDEIDKSQTGAFGHFKIGALNVRQAFEEVGLRKHFDELDAAAREAERGLNTLKGTTDAYFASLPGQAPTLQQLQNGWAEADQVGQRFKEHLDLLSKAGVQVGDDLATVTFKVNKYKSSTTVGADATKDVVKALGDMSDAGKDAEQAVSDLKDALDRLIGVFLSADDASDKYSLSLLQLKKDIEGNGKSLDGNTEGAIKNRQAFRDLVEQIKDDIDAHAKAGESAEDLSKRLETNRQRLLDAGKAAGFSTEQMEALLTKFNLTPELVRIIVEALGAKDAAGQVQDLQNKLNTAAQTVARPRIELIGADVAVSNLTAMQRMAENLDGSSVKVRVTGPRGDGPGNVGAAGSAHQMAGAAVAMFGGRITSGYRTPAQNAAAGGSPTSYHLDRSNPANDIVTPNMSATFNWLRDTYGGQLRELIYGHRMVRSGKSMFYAPSDHFDHIHVAHSGGEVTSAWTRMPGDRPDERTARLQVGEWVSSRSSVATERQSAAPAAPTIVQVPTPTEVIVVDADGKLVGTMKVVANQASRAPLRAISHGRR